MTKPKKRKSAREIAKSNLQKLRRLFYGEFTYESDKEMAVELAVIAVREDRRERKRVKK